MISKIRFYLAVDNNWHHDLAGRVAVARNMSRVLLHVENHLARPRSRCSATDTFAQSNRLAGDFALERSEDQLALSLRIENVEA